MTNAESKQQYEGAILQQLIKNSERLVTVENTLATVAVEVHSSNKKVNALEQKIDILEQKTDYIYKSLKWIIGLLGAILIAVLANLLSQPLLSLFA